MMLPDRPPEPAEFGLSTESAFRGSEAGAHLDTLAYRATQMVQASEIRSYKPLLPILFNLKGKPYHINDHSPFEPFYRTRMPMKMIGLAGRQIAKSTNLAIQGLTTSAVIPNFSTLYVTPLYEQVRRFSSNYVRRAIEESPIRRVFSGPAKLEKSVLQRSLHNGSSMHFSFAFLTADRTRGLPADRVTFDEIQDMDPDHVPIIVEALSHSPWKLVQYMGTPKTLDNASAIYWEDSSQARWAMRCGCGYWNIPALTHDLEKMLGPWSEDISEAKPGTVCAKCGQHISPRNGQWTHAFPERRWDFAGYHFPQFIFPFHFADMRAWQLLLAKRDKLPYHIFLNEVCGESYDLGAKLVTITDLQRAATLGPNVRELASQHIHDYIHRVVGVDWGGGGEQGISFTTIAVLGMKASGDIDVIFGYRSMMPHAHLEEAQFIRQIVQEFQASHIAHDFCGSGSLRETFLVQAGFPMHRLLPMVYTRLASHEVMRLKKANKTNRRSYYVVDKARSLVLTCNQIQTQHIKFFAYDYKGEQDIGLLRDFLALQEEKVDRRGAADLFVITRNPKRSDDFAQSVNYGCCALWFLTKKWPQIATDARFQLSLDELSGLNADISNLDEWLMDDGGYDDFG